MITSPSNPSSTRRPQLSNVYVNDAATLTDVLYSYGLYFYNESPLVFSSVRGGTLHPSGFMHSLTLAYAQVSM